MMVLERWMVAAIVAVGLVSTAFGQSTAPPQPHSAKIKTRSKGAPPADSGTPEQAVRPDPSAPLTETPNYDPPPPPPPPPAPDPPPTPPVAAAPASAVPASAPPASAAPASAPLQETPVVQETEPPPAPLRPMTAQEQQMEKDSARLLTLARELKEEVTKAGAETLSLEALRKAEEIQRLSKDLRDRLKLQAANGGNQTTAGAQ